MANPVSTALAKLPWYGQVGVFVVLSLILGGVFYYYVETPAQAAMATRQRGTGRDSIAGHAGADQGAPAAGIPQADRRARGPARSAQADSAERARRRRSAAPRADARGAVEPDHPRLPAAGRSRVADMHAEWPISLQLEGNYHNFGVFLDRVSKFPRIINIGNMTLADQPVADRRVEHAHRRDGHDLRPDGAHGSTERRRTSGEEMMNTRALSIPVVALVAALAVSPVVRAQAPAAGQPAPQDRRAAGHRQGRSAGAARELRIRGGRAARSVPEPGEPRRRPAQHRQSAGEARRRRARNDGQRNDGARHRADARRLGGDGRPASTARSIRFGPATSWRTESFVR